MAGATRVTPVLLLTLLALPAAFGQETTASLQGVVRDPTSAVVANAKLELTGSSLIGNRQVQSDEQGRYRFAALPPGDYLLTVSAPGFRTFKQSGITLAVGRLPTLDIRLEVGAVAETVEVSGDAAVVDTTQSKVAVTVAQAVLDSFRKAARSNR